MPHLTEGIRSDRSLLSIPNASTRLVPDSRSLRRPRRGRAYHQESRRADQREEQPWQRYAPAERLVDTNGIREVAGPPVGGNGRGHIE